MMNIEKMTIKGAKGYLSLIWMLPLVILLATIIIGSSKNKRELSEKGIEDSNSFSNENYAVIAFELPDKIDFAGERVPLEYYDVRESLDRELLSNTYFHSQTIRLIKMANRYFPEIEKILEEEGLPDDFKYLAMAESGLANVVSPAGARGFWQIRKGTGTDYGLEITNEVDERYHLEKSTRVACEYLKESFEKYGNWTMAAASYNVGRKGIDRQIEKQKENNYYDLLLNEETARYIFRILAFKIILTDPESYGLIIGEDELYQPLNYKVISLDGPVENFADFAKEHGTNYKLLKELNPWLRENSLTNPGGRTYEIRILLDR